MQPERIGDDADLVLVGAQGDDRALLVELLLEDDDVALDLVARRLDDVEALRSGSSSWPGLSVSTLIAGGG